MRRLLGVMVAALALSGCGSSICDCGPPEQPVEFTGRLVAMDLGDADGPDGSDIAVYEVATWGSGTPAVAEGDRITVTYWETGHLLEVGEPYLVGASVLHDGNLYSGVPTAEHCECGPLTRRPDGTPVDSGLWNRFDHLRPWWAIWVIGPVVAVAAMATSLLGRRRSGIRHLLGAATAALTGLAAYGAASAIWIARLGREPLLVVAAAAIAGVAALGAWALARSRHGRPEVRDGVGST